MQWHGSAAWEQQSTLRQQVCLGLLTLAHGMLWSRLFYLQPPVRLVSLPSTHPALCHSTYVAGLACCVCCVGLFHLWRAPQPHHHRCFCVVCAAHMHGHVQSVGQHQQHGGRAGCTAVAGSKQCTPAGAADCACGGAAAQALLHNRAQSGWECKNSGCWFLFWGDKLAAIFWQAASGSGRQCQSVNTKLACLSWAEASNDEQLLLLLFISTVAIAPVLFCEHVLTETLCHHVLSLCWQLPDTCNFSPCWRSYCCCCCCCCRLAVGCFQ